MSRILIPSSGPDDWRQFLAKPDLHWKTGWSARTLAHSWEAGDGIPPEVAAIMEQAFGSPQLLFAVPEHKTGLPGGTRESQSDVLALVRHPAGLATYTIEGKVDEPFGPTAEEWSANASPGKVERLDHVCGLLGLDHCPGDVRYQLLHRTAAALIEAERFDAKLAGMLVHSFSPESRWRDEFTRFAALLGCHVEPGRASVVTVPSGKSLAIGWASGDQQFRAA